MEEFPNRYERYIDLARLSSYLRPDAPGDLSEVALRSALSASELSLLIIEDAASDPRPSFDGAGLIDMVLATTAELLEGVADLLALVDAPLPHGAKASAPSQDTGLAGLSRLTARHRRPIDRLTRTILCAFEGRPYRLGLEGAAHDLRHGFGLPALPDAPGDAPFLPYDAWIRPAALRAMPHGAEVPYGPEDRLFALTHQISECWFALSLHLLRGAKEHALRRSWGDAAWRVARTAELLPRVSRNVHVLGFMVIADFHPLRVALQGASGAQSRAAIEIIDLTAALFAPLDAALSEAGTPLLDVLQRPERYPGERGYIKALQDMEVSATEFFFHHYRLVTRVIGVGGVGTGGTEVTRMIPRFTAPLFPRLNAAQFQMSELASLSCADRLGGFFVGDDRHLSSSATARILEAQMGVPAERLSAIVKTYFTLMSAGETDAFAHLFAIDGYVEDPQGSAKWRGEADLRAYFLTFIKRFPGVQIAPSGAIAVKGNVATVPWSASGRACIGEEISFAGETTFYFKATGQISAVKVSFDPAELGKKLGYIERYSVGDAVLRPLTVAVLGHPSGAVARELLTALGALPTRTWLPEKLFRDSLPVEAIRWISACDEMGPGLSDLLRGASCAVVLVQPSELSDLPDLCRLVVAAVKEAGVRRLAWVVPAAADSLIGAQLEEANASVAGRGSTLILRHEPLFSHLLLCRDEQNAPSQLLLPDAARPIRWISPDDIAAFLSRWIRDDLPDASLYMAGPEALTGPDLVRILVLAARRTDAGRAAAEKRFELIDHNADGALSRGELGSYLSSIGYGPGVVEEALKRVDRNADGGLRFDEFFLDLDAALGEVLGSFAAEIACLDVTAAALSARLVKRGFTAPGANAFVSCLTHAEEQEEASPAPERAPRTPISAWALQHAVQFMDVHILPGNGVFATRASPRGGEAGTESRLVRPDGHTLTCWQAKDQRYVKLRWGEADKGDVKSYRYAAGDVERTLEVREERLVGITVQGAWAGLRDAGKLIFSGEHVPSWKLTLFTHLGDLTMGDRGADAELMVCTCANVTREKLLSLIDQGSTTMVTLCNASRSAKFCGACRPQIESILSEHTRSALFPQVR